ncbi:MAG: phosphoethanolamine transferase domain-containing protein [Ramlibacter sp.]|nr:phosphoethanolamine transferase domain-containing protein [Ramlibacter sp.]
MSLKLFRSTGYSSILSAGETRVATHPGWVILLTSLWTGFAGNAALWRELSAPASGGLGTALVTAAFVAAASAVVLSLLGWRKTLKPAATAVLFVAALGAHHAAGQPSMGQSGVYGLSLPSPAGLMQWQTWVGVVLLALVPAVFICKVHLRRLPGQQQLRVNVTGAMLAAAVLAASGSILYGGRY